MGPPGGVDWHVYSNFNPNPRVRFRTLFREDFVEEPVTSLISSLVAVNHRLNCVVGSQFYICLPFRLSYLPESADNTHYNNMFSTADLTSRYSSLSGMPSVQPPESMVSNLDHQSPCSGHLWHVMSGGESTEPRCDGAAI